MAKRKIVWTETASRQRREILKYWTERNKSSAYALKLIKITSSRLKTISKNPGTNKKCEFPGTRVAAMGHFSIFYKEEADQIIVTAFWDNRQDPKKILELLNK